MKILVFCTLVVLAQGGALPPTIVRPSDGTQIITGSIASGDTYTLVRFKVFNPDGSLAESVDTLVQARRDFVAALREPLKVGQVVAACALIDGNETACTNPVAVLASKTAGPVCPEPAGFTVTPKEGQMRVYGIASPSSSALKCSIAVFINGDAATVVDSQGHDASSVATDSDGHFTAGLKGPLEPGQCVSLAQFTPGRWPAASDCNGPQAQLVSSFLDLGRARTHFTSGVMMARGDAGSTTPNLYLSFDYDKNWIWGGPKAKGMQRLMLNTFFNMGLTAVPVVATAATPAAGGGALDTFLSSRKAAELQSGLYIPYITTTWSHDRALHAFTIGPIAKAGFATPIEAGASSFYTSYGFGTRLGLSKLSSSHDVAPDLVSYFDVVMGRFSALDTNHRPWRFGFEGALRIPATPFVIGVSANVHQNFGLGSHTTVYGSKDDLRFYFGMKFDVANLLGRLKPLN